MCALTIAAVAAVRPAAAAAPIDQDYRSAMKYFVGDLDRWADKVEAAAEAAIVKPELACGAEMVELAEIAGSLGADLRGTGYIAPADMRAVHAALTESVMAIGTHASAACGDAAASAQAIRTERVNFESALSRIDGFVRYGFEGR
jgi:hypothetical protein